MHTKLQDWEKRSMPLVAKKSQKILKKNDSSLESEENINLAILFWGKMHAPTGLLISTKNSDTPVLKRRQWCSFKNGSIPCKFFSGQ